MEITKEQIRNVDNCIKEFDGENWDKFFAVTMGCFNKTTLGAICRGEYDNLEITKNENNT